MVKSKKTTPFRKKPEDFKRKVKKALIGTGLAVGTIAALAYLAKTYPKKSEDQQSKDQQSKDQQILEAKRLEAERLEQQKQRLEAQQLKEQLLEKQRIEQLERQRSEEAKQLKLQQSEALTNIRRILKNYNFSSSSSSDQCKIYQAVLKDLQNRCDPYWSYQVDKEKCYRKKIDIDEYIRNLKIIGCNI
jgi:hypothetical protein